MAKFATYVVCQLEFYKLEVHQLETHQLLMDFLFIDYIVYGLQLLMDF